MIFRFPSQVHDRKCAGSPTPAAANCKPPGVQLGCSSGAHASGQPLCCAGERPYCVHMYFYGRLLCSGTADSELVHDTNERAIC